MATIKMKDGRLFADIQLDGGGTALTGDNAGRRELHGTFWTPAGTKSFCEFEDEIERVILDVGEDGRFLGEEVTVL